MKYLKVLFFFSTLLCGCKSYKILAVSPVPVHSVYILNLKMVTELANRGHEVTIVTPFPQKNPVTNLKEIDLESVASVMDGDKKRILDLATKSAFAYIEPYGHMGYTLTEKVLQHENIQKLLQTKEKYDVVMLPHFLNEALLGIGHHFKAPVVLFSAMPQFAWGSFQLSHPAPSSYVPNLCSAFTGHMNFWQRLLNSFYDAYTILYHQWVILPKHRELVKRYIPAQPDLYDFLNNASLLLINSHMSTYDALPQVPNAIEIGGFHIQEPKKLSEDLQKFLDDSEDGVIVFSLGSVVKTSELPESVRDEVLKAFSKLKQNVLWKWHTEAVPLLPKNVKIMKWLPQSDVLAHPNVKVFITHGGMLSTMESLYYGVPTIGIPFFGDQKMNMATAASYGYALVVPFNELNERRLSHALDQILNDPKYSNNAKRRSAIMRDRPMKPIDTAVYWIEYVVRHHGAPHLRYPGMDLSWYQRNMIDVIAFVLIIMSFLIFLIIRVYKRIVRVVVYNPANGAKKTN